MLAMRQRLRLLVLGLALGATATVYGQGTLSEQVLRLLVRDNYWSGTQTYARTVGVTLESGLVPPTLTANSLYNLNGALYFNGVLVATSAGAGTVTSVALSLPAIFTVSGSPVSTTGTLTGTLATQTANRVWAGPTTGSAAAPTFRALVAADIPAISAGTITGTVPVANGGTGLTAGTSGGVLAYTATGTLASSGALTVSRIVLGGGAGAVPTVMGSLGTTSTLLHGNAAGAPTFSAVALASDVSGTLPFANGGTGLSSGTSGGLLYFSGTTTLASSGAYTANRLLTGGGAAAAPVQLGSLGTTTTLLHGNAAGAPTFGAVSLTADVSGTLPVANGGSGATTLTGLLRGNGTSAFSIITTSSTVGEVLRVTAADTYAWGALNLADTDAVTGALGVAYGGTALTGTPANGQLAVGNGTNYTLATLTGTANQVVVTNGAGTITLSTPQSIATASTPQFARLGLGTGAGATAVITTTGTFNIGYAANGNCGAGITVSFAAGMQQTVTLNAATCTLAFSNPIAGAPPYRLVLTQDATGGRLITWPGTVLWEGGAAPTLTAAANAVDICTFLYNGTNYFGSCSLDY